MLINTETENQKVLVEDLRNQMPIWQPPDGAVFPGYIAGNDADFVPLDENTVAWRSGGGEWATNSLDDFRAMIAIDREELLGPVGLGYIATCRWFNRAASVEWTDGIDFVPLEDDIIAWRSSGDYRNDSEWRVGSLDAFRENVVIDAEEILERWLEESEDT